MGLRWCTKTVPPSDPECIMATKDKTPRCHCWVCRGRAKIPAEYGRPAVFPHEIEQGLFSAYRAPEVAPTKKYLSLATEGISLAPKKAGSYVHSDLPSEVLRKVEAIRARTDIGNGMKNMQIANLTRKYAR